MENLYLSVIPAHAGIPQHIAPVDARFRGDDSSLTFIDSLLWGEGQNEGASITPSLSQEGEEDQGAGRFLRLLRILDFACASNIQV
jgi:hypothetical protein